MSEDAKVLLYLLRHGSWRVRACLAFIATGMVVVDPVLRGLQRLADAAQEGVQTLCSRVADVSVEEVRELGKRYRQENPR